jgi:hypothetical protein
MVLKQYCGSTTQFLNRRKFCVKILTGSGAGAASKCHGSATLHRELVVTSYDPDLHKYKIRTQICQNALDRYGTYASVSYLGVSPQASPGSPQSWCHPPLRQLLPPQSRPTESRLYTNKQKALKGLSSEMDAILFLA